MAELATEDAQLVSALRAGDEATFARLVAEWSGSMLRVAQIYVSSRAVAEEVVQETWLSVIRALPQFEGRSLLRTWVFRILTNTAKTRAQREGRTVPFSALRDPGRVPEPAVDGDRFLDAAHARWPGHWASPPTRWDTLPEERLLGEETRQVIERAIDGLPPSQRAVITLRDVEAWSAEEVRNALELSESNQRVLLHRARAKVRRAIEEYAEES
ncbi:MAG: sigma-70 family RNA polymerase sigma factor [Actinomycetota bacterium]|nr:sigma-70 family RNA polymerase sigma factor [Actinomycetota bacterium]